MNQSPVLIRRMLPSDAYSVAMVHTQSWQTAYKGIIDQSVLDALSIEARTEGWKRSCELNNPPNILLVAELDKQIVGIASGLEHRFKAELPTCDCELAAIYVDPKRTSSGVGQALLKQFKIEMQKLGKTKLCIWTLEANTSARRFYERQGGVQSGSKSFTIGNQTLPEVGYTFDLLTPATEWHHS